MKKSPLSFIGGAISSGMTNIVGRALNNQQNSFGSIANPFGVFNESTFSQDPNYRGSSSAVTRATEAGSGANYSTSADPAAIYGDGTMGPNSRYTNSFSNVTRSLHDAGLNEGPKVGGVVQSRGQVDQRNKFLATNSANAAAERAASSVATSNNFSPTTQNVAMDMYGAPENMDSSILPNNIDATGINSLYGGPLST